MAARRRKATNVDWGLRILIALVLVSAGILGGLLIRGTTGTGPPAPADAARVETATSTTLSTEPPTTTTTVPPTTTTTTTTSVCEQSEPIGGCQLGTPAAIAWAQQQDQAAQAAATEQAVQAYEQCLNNNAQAIAAQIGQTLGRVSGIGSPTWESCSTVGLTPAQIQQAQQAEGGSP
jgi:hypothetical protein